MKQQTNAQKRQRFPKVRLQLPVNSSSSSMRPIPQKVKDTSNRWKYGVGGLVLLILIVLLIQYIFFREEEYPKPQRKWISSKPALKRTLVSTTTTTPPVDYKNPAYMDVCYSMRLVVSSYNGPVVKIEKNDGTQQDIYTDETQSFMTVDPNNQGMSVEEWLGTAVGKVRVWYDQSGNGNHALCYSYCPILSSMGSDKKYVLRFQQYTDSGMQIRPVQPYAIFFQFWHDNNDPAKIISTNVDPAIKQYYGVIIQNGNIYGNKSQYDWYYTAKDDKDFTINQDDSPEYDLGKWNTVCLSVQNPQYPSDENLTLIGKDLSGFLSELILYNRPMGQDAMDAYQKNPLEVGEN